MDTELLVDYEKTIAKTHFFENYQAKKKQLKGFMKDWEILQEDLEKFS